MNQQGQKEKWPRRCDNNNNNLHINNDDDTSQKFKQKLMQLVR